MAYEFQKVSLKEVVDQSINNNLLLEQKRIDIRISKESWVEQEGKFDIQFESKLEDSKTRVGTNHSTFGLITNVQNNLASSTGVSKNIKQGFTVKASLDTNKVNSEVPGISKGEYANTSTFNLGFSVPLMKERGQYNLSSLRSAEKKIPRRGLWLFA